MQGQGDFELFSADAAFQEGLDLLEADHFEEALRAFDFVISHQPYHADAFFHRGIALINLGRGPESAAAFKSAVEIAPTDPAYHSHYGYALMMGGHLDDAVERFDYALDLQPDGYQNKIYKACALAEKRNLGMAKALLEEVLEDHPDDPEALRHHAAICALLGRDAEALSEYESLLAQSPNNLDIMRRVAQIHVRRGSRDDAIRLLRQIVAMDSADRAAWETLVRFAEERGDRQSLLAYATEAIASDVESAAILLARGRAHLAQRRTDMAMSDLRKARDLDESSADAHYWFARACFEAGRMRQAASGAARALQLRPRDKRTALLKAQIHRQAGELGQEYQCLQILAGGPGASFEVTQMLARNLMARGKTVEAVAAVDSFLHRRPQHTSALLLSAELSERAGDFGQAAWCYRQVLKQPQTDARSHRRFGEFLLRRSETTEAAEVFQRGVNLFPGDEGLLSHWAAVLQVLGRHDDCVAAVRQWSAAHRPTAELYWLMGKSLYALREYSQALLAFHDARALETRCNGTSAPTFRCLVAEAFTLHHLGSTMEGIRLLEQHIGQFQKFEKEFHEELALLYEHARINTKAYTMYARCMERFGPSASLHYRMARTAAAIGRRHEVLHHMYEATLHDRALCEMAAAEPAFARYRFDFAFQRLIGFHGLRQQAPAIIALGVTGISALALVLSRLF